MADIRIIAFDKLWQRFVYVALGANTIMFKNECISVLGIL